MEEIKVLCFDIDQVFNSKKGHDFLSKFFKGKENKLNDLKSLSKEAHQILVETVEKFGIRFLKDPRFPSGYHFGDFIETDLIDEIATIVKTQNVITIGVSSWFHEDDPQYLKRVSDCLGFPVHHIGCSTGDASCRLKSCYNWLEQNILPHQTARVVYLDDMISFDLTYDYPTYENSILFVFKEMLSKYNTLFISPKNGLKPNEIQNIIKWFS